MIRADSIANKEFKKALFGYDREDVDRYLDELIIQLRQMEEERREMVSTIEYLVSEMTGQARKTSAHEDAVGPISPHATVSDAERRRAAKAEKASR